MNDPAIPRKWAIIIHINAFQAERKSSAINQHNQYVCKDVKLGHEFEYVQVVQAKHVFDENGIDNGKQYRKQGKLLKGSIEYNH